MEPRIQYAKTAALVRESTTSPTMQAAMRMFFQLHAPQRFPAPTRRILIPPKT
jgi:hypothetical protein